MKKYLALAVALSFATSVATFAADDAAITAKEKSAWQAFKDNKPDEFKKILGGDLVAVYADGIMNMQNELDAMKATTMKSFAMSDVKVSSPDADTAVITYKCKVERTYEGKEDNGTYNCGSVWRKQGSEWKGIFHCDSKEAAAAK